MHDAVKSTRINILWGIGIEFRCEKYRRDADLETRIKTRDASGRHVQRL